MKSWIMQWSLGANYTNIRIRNKEKVVTFQATSISVRFSSQHVIPSLIFFSSGKFQKSFLQVMQTKTSMTWSLGQIQNSKAEIIGITTAWSTIMNHYYIGHSTISWTGTCMLKWRHRGLIFVPKSKPMLRK